MSPLVPDFPATWHGHVFLATVHRSWLAITAGSNHFSSTRPGDCRYCHCSCYRHPSLSIAYHVWFYTEGETFGCHGKSIDKTLTLYAVVLKDSATIDIQRLPLMWTEQELKELTLRQSSLQI